jgi:hypothetical protein
LNFPNVRAPSEDFTIDQIQTLLTEARFQIEQEQRFLKGKLRSFLYYIDDETVGTDG